jgi:Predicted membrane protein
MERTNDSGEHIFGLPFGLVLIVAYKGIWGVVELLGGILVFFSHAILAGELTEDPQDIFANWVFAHLGVADARRIGSVIILLGAIKLAIAIGIWYRSWWMRKAALIFFCAASIFGLYEIITAPTLFKVGALIIDLFLIYYFWKVLPKHFRQGKIV